MTPLERDNRELRALVARLTEKVEDYRHQVRELKRELSVKVATDVMAALHAHYTSLTPGDAWVLAALYTARGKLVTHKSLLEEMPGLRPDERDPRILLVRMSNVRVALGRECIKRSYGVGYALTAEGLAKCDAVFAEQGKA